MEVRAIIGDSLKSILKNYTQDLMTLLILVVVTKLVTMKVEIIYLMNMVSL
jgi:hypothetical protein